MNPHTTIHNLPLLASPSSPPTSELSQITQRHDPKHKLPLRIRHDRELLPLPTTLLLKESLQLFQLRPRMNDLIRRSVFAPCEFHHGRTDGVGFGDFAGCEEGVQRWDVDVAEEAAGWGNDSKMRVVAFEGCEEGC